MLSVSRTVWGIHITQIYFPDEIHSVLHSAKDLVGITQSRVPLRGLLPLETLQKNLTHSEEELFKDISKSTRSQIKQMQKEASVQRLVLTEPTDEVISRFRDFYNELAKVKKTHPCSPFNVQTLRELNSQKALAMTVMQTAEGQTLCYRVYAVDGHRSMSLYSASHFRMSDDAGFRKWVGKAHRLLIWEDMLYFKEQGYEIYDSGGLTNNLNIRNFKLEFGGDVITEYSGYLPVSLKGRLALMARKWKMSRVKSEKG